MPVALVDPMPRTSCGGTCRPDRPYGLRLLPPSVATFSSAEPQRHSRRFFSSASWRRDSSRSAVNLATRWRSSPSSLAAASPVGAASGDHHVGESLLDLGARRVAAADAQADEAHHCLPETGIAPGNKGNPCLCR